MYIVHKNLRLVIVLHRPFFWSLFAISFSLWPTESTAICLEHAKWPILVKLCGDLCHKMDAGNPCIFKLPAFNSKLIFSTGKSWNYTICYERCVKNIRILFTGISNKIENRNKKCVKINYFSLNTVTVIWYGNIMYGVHMLWYVSNNFGNIIFQNRFRPVNIRCTSQFITFHLVFWFCISVALNNKALIRSGIYVKVVRQICVTLQMINGPLLPSARIPL